jgi:hypothetical protein
MGSAAPSAARVAFGSALAIAPEHGSLTRCDPPGARDGSPGKRCGWRGVSLSPTGSSKSSQVTTLADGSYLFGGLQAGKYTLKVEAKRFELFTRDVTVAQADSLRVDAALKITADRQSVTVTVDAREANVLAPDPAERVLIREETQETTASRLPSSTRLEISFARTICRPTRTEMATPIPTF